MLKMWYVGCCRRISHISVVSKTLTSALILVRSANNGGMGLLWENLSARERKHGSKYASNGFLTLTHYIPRTGEISLLNFVSDRKLT